MYTPIPIGGLLLLNEFCQRFSLLRQLFNANTTLQLIMKQVHQSYQKTEKHNTTQHNAIFLSVKISELTYINAVCCMIVLDSEYQPSNSNLLHQKTAKEFAIKDLFETKQVPHYLGNGSVPYGKFKLQTRNS
jgi:hypothetical protein